MSTLADLYGLCGCGVRTHLTQDELDELGLLLDRLEEVEIFLDTNCSPQDRKDAEVEFETLTDRIQLMIDRV